jgi:hypothetical protein
VSAWSSSVSPEGDDGFVLENVLHVLDDQADTRSARTSITIMEDTQRNLSNKL